MEWLQRKKRKDKFKRDTLDIAKLENEKRLAARQKRIESAQKKREKHSKALKDLRKNRSQKLSGKNDDDDSSFCASTIASTASSKKRSKATPVKKVAQKKKKKVTTMHETPEPNKVTKYLITPVATNPNVPATVSTVASSVSTYGCPPGTIRQYDNRVQSETLPDSVRPKTDEPSWTDNNKKPEKPSGRRMLPSTALCSPGDIKPGQCYGCKYMFDKCLERKYRDFCLQAVKNHIDDVGYTDLTEFSVRKAYHNEYMSQVRRDLKEATGYYEANQLLDIPQCMIQGSLNDALCIVSGSAVGVPIVEYLMQQRMYNVEQHLQDKEHERLRKEYEEYERTRNCVGNDDDGDDY